MIRCAVIAACGAIVVVELFEWLAERTGNFSSGLVIGLAVLCIIVVARGKDIQ